MASSKEMASLLPANFIPFGKMTSPIHFYRTSYDAVSHKGLSQNGFPLYTSRALNGTIA